MSRLGTLSEFASSQLGPCSEKSCILTVSQIGAVVDHSEPKFSPRVVQSPKHGNGHACSHASIPAVIGRHVSRFTIVCRIAAKHRTKPGRANGFTSKRKGKESSKKKSPSPFGRVHYPKYTFYFSCKLLLRARTRLCCVLRERSLCLLEIERIPRGHSWARRRGFGGLGPRIVHRAQCNDHDGQCAIAAEEARWREYRVVKYGRE